MIFEGMFLIFDVLKHDFQKPFLMQIRLAIWKEEVAFIKTKFCIF